MDTVQALERAREIIHTARMAKETAEAMARITGISPGQGDSPDTGAALERELEQLRHQVEPIMAQALTERERLIVECFYLRGETISTIAQGLRLCVHTIKRTKANALRRMREDASSP